MRGAKRKGARTTKEIPEEILQQLNKGELESANVVEWFAIDRRGLLRHLLVQQNRENYYAPVIAVIEQLEKQTSNKVSEAIGEGLLQQITQYEDRELLPIIAQHPSDLARSWGTFIIGKNHQLSLAKMLEEIKPFAEDHHFNVREEAWTAVRPKVIENLAEALVLLAKWSRSDDENIRRFASEVTRPRGVWCKQIEPLKENPALALSIIEPLKSDASKYVRDSVGNWLNDASKTQSDGVRQLCDRWEAESDTKETKYIIKKTLRTINKAKK